MNNLFRGIENIFNSGDPTLRTWFLIRQNYLPFILCGCYAVFSSTIGPALMKNRKPFELRTFMTAFNFSLVLTYTTCLILAIRYIPEVPKEQLCKGITVTKGEVTYTLAIIAWLIYMVKYVEFLDTVIFILRKKENQITFLHVMHHTVVPIIGWIVLRTERSGLGIIPAIINSVIHIIMYTYYGLAAMGPEIKKHLWWKKYLTQLQILQFLIFIVFMVVATPLSGCPILISSYIIGIIFCPLFLYLFYKYYQSSLKDHRKQK